MERPLWANRVGRAAACVLLMLPLACVPIAASANPWLKDSGAGELISDATITRQQSGLAPGTQASAYSNLHLEYGVVGNVTLVADSSFQQYVANGMTRSAFDTAWAGPRIALKRWDNSILSFEGVGGISGIRQNTLPDSPLALSGTAEARLMFGQGFEVFARHAFAGVEGGWRWRAGAPANEFLLDTVAGIAPWQSALLMLQSFSIAGSGTARGAYRRYDLVKLQLSLAQRLTPRWWIQAGAIASVAGSDAGDAGGVFGIWRRF